jgi:carbamoyl-phosphate synthase small subunit
VSSPTNGRRPRGPSLRTAATTSRVCEGRAARVQFPDRHVICVDYGAKRNILRCLAGVGCGITVVPARTSAASILALRPNGIFLANGPSDPPATSGFAVPVVRELLASGQPIFGICLGHQLLALAQWTRRPELAHGSSPWAEGPRRCA